MNQVPEGCLERCLALQNVAYFQGGRLHTDFRQPFRKPHSENDDSRLPTLAIILREATSCCLAVAWRVAKPGKCGT